MLEWASLRSKPDLREANGPASSGGLPDPKSGRKTGISLALGGGCARGWAHIGVLRALDEAGIEVSMIAGTSVGALVGGCYV
ncbi:MAG: Patatin, partial [Mesorhizobium sp.]